MNVYATKFLTQKGQYANDGLDVNSQRASFVSSKKLFSSAINYKRIGVVDGSTIFKLGITGRVFLTKKQD